ncbi:MAG TPA: GGDEF domain-containing protein [Candidatus Limnocylindria bacterium]|nr:GGDEF domain-containing protein [Candidatus Limnocylindria bacterium]
MGGTHDVTVDESLVVLAIIMAILVNLFFLFRVLPWARPGPWRIIWGLAAMFSLMFILAEGSVLTEGAMSAADVRHQVPLFAALLTGAAGFVIAYTQGYGISERSRSLALLDPLTQLANLRAIHERLRQATETGERFTLVYVDLDGFKNVNDRFGHSKGDDVLRRVAEVLRRSVRGADLAGRVGGDEFVLLLANTDPPQVPVVAGRVLAGLHALDIGDGVRIGGSFGVSTARDGTSPADIVAAADGAMYRAKQAGGGRLALAGREEISVLAA